MFNEHADLIQQFQQQKYLIESLEMCQLKIQQLMTPYEQKITDITQKLENCSKQYEESKKQIQASIKAEEKKNKTLLNEYTSSVAQKKIETCKGLGDYQACLAQIQPEINNAKLEEYNLRTTELKSKTKVLTEQLESFHTDVVAHTKKELGEVKEKTKAFNEQRAANSKTLQDLKKATISLEVLIKPLGEIETKHEEQRQGILDTITQKLGEINQNRDTDSQLKTEGHQLKLALLQSINEPPEQIFQSPLNESLQKSLTVREFLQHYPQFETWLQQYNDNSE